MSLSSKDRAELRKHAHHMPVTVHIGHQGITESVRQTLDDALRTRELATKLVAGKDTTIGGFAAYDATIEIANTDQLKLDPERRQGKLRVILVRTPYLYLFGSKTMLPTLLVLGYYNRPADFDASLPDFERFLTLVRLGPQY